MVQVSRRQFMQVSMGAAAAGLTFGVQLPGFGAEPDDEGEFSPSVFIHIPSGADKVRVTCHRSEMGQGIRTAISMMIAEELEVRLDQIEVEQAPGDSKYGDQNTDGSRSVRQNWEPLRQAAAAARKRLMYAAAEKWKAPLSDCYASEGAVVHGPSKKRLKYRQLARLAAETPEVTEAVLKKKSQWKILGQSQRGVDNHDIVTGTAQFGIDVELPGLVYASIERAPTKQSQLVSFDKEAALEVPGVIEVVQLESLKLRTPFTFESIAVVASNTWSAEMGRRKLNASWKVEEGAENSSENLAAMRADTKKKGRPFREEGDVDDALRGAAKVVEATYTGPYLAHAPMEPPCATAHYEEVSTQGGTANGRCTIWAPTQNPASPPLPAEQLVSQLLKIPEVEVKVTLLGGGFGRKAKPDFILEAAQLSRKLRRPVKVTWTRSDEIRHGFYRALNCQYISASLSSDGAVTGWLHRTSFPSIVGSIFDPTQLSPSDFEVGQGLSNFPYRIPNQRFEKQAVLTSVRIGWLRSVCHTFHAFAINSFLDEIAHELKKDPIELHLELLGKSRIVPGRVPHPDYEFNTGRLARVIREAKEFSNWGQEQPAGTAQGFAAHFSFFSYVAMVATVALESGQPKVRRVDCVVDCGTVINPDTVRAQIEGSVAFALSYTLHSKLDVVEGAVQQSNFHDYKLLRINEMPEVRVNLIKSDRRPSGMGEPAVPPVAAAVTNALFRLTGKRWRDLPING